MRVRVMHGIAGSIGISKIFLASLIMESNSSTSPGRISCFSSSGVQLVFGGFPYSIATLLYLNEFGHR